MNKKYKVMNQKPEASDEEIESYMNFEGLMNKRAEVLSSSKIRSILKKGLAGIAIGVALVSVFWFAQTRTGNRQQQNDLNPEKKTVISPSKVESNAVSDSVEHLQSQPKETPRPDHSAKKESPDQKAESLDKSVPEKTTVDESYVQAEPVNGYPDLYAYLNKNLVYPKEAMKDSIQGVLTIAFIINSSGKPEKIEIVNSLGPLFDAEARRLVENMPAWKPAIMNGKPVASKISLPVTFQLVKIKAHN